MQPRKLNKCAASLLLLLAAIAAHAKPPGELDGAGCSNDTPCTASGEQASEACDIANRCSCPRGFKLQDGKCVDVDECSGEQRLCSDDAVCTNTVGSYTCECDHGYYYNGRYCVANGVSSSDRLCDACGEDAYDFHRCEQPKQLLCIPIAYGSAEDKARVQNAGGAADPFHVLIDTISTNNAFIEDLEQVQEVSDTLYVTSNHNAYEVNMIRSSNMTVRVRISDLQLLPELQDYSVDGDNAFMLNRKGSRTPEQATFDSIVKSYCRNPMPDYYSLILEFYRGRTTLMKEALCDSANRELRACPESLIDGVDTIRYRSLNEPCPGSGLSPQRLFEDSSSILCTENSPLLSDLFNRTLAPERYEMLSNRSAECKDAEAECERCESVVRQEDAVCFPSTHNTTFSEQLCPQCSRIQCYSQPYCRRSMRPLCAETPPACARGDVARITLQPVFASIQSEFRCPVNFAQPKRLPDSNLVSLFRVDFSLEIPHLSFKSATLQETVTEQIAPSALFSESGSAKVAFFDVDYQMNLQSLSQLNHSVDFVLLGKLQNDSRYDLRLERIKSETKWSRQRVIVTDNRMLVALVQPRKPFAISTSTWTKHQHNCHLNVDELYANQDMVDPEESEALNTSDFKVDRIKMEVLEQKMHEGEPKVDPFSYSVMSKAAFPSVSFRMPAKRSALQHFYANQGNILQTDANNLHTSIHLDASTSIFNFTIYGRVKKCGLLRLLLTEAYSRTTVLRWDALVGCMRENPLSPQSFAVSSAFQLHSAAGASDASHSKYVFELKVSDLTVTHTIKLVYDEPVQSLMLKAPLVNSKSKTASKKETKKFKKAKLDVVRPNSFTPPTMQNVMRDWTTSANLVMLTAVIIFSYLFLIFAHCAFRLSKRFNLFSPFTYPSSAGPAALPVTSSSVVLDSNAIGLNVFTQFMPHASPKSNEEAHLTSPNGQRVSKNNRRNGTARQGTNVCILSIIVFARILHHIVFNVSLFLTVVLFLNQNNLRNVETMFFNASFDKSFETRPSGSSSATQTLTQSQSQSQTQTQTHRLTLLGNDFAHLAQLSSMCDARLSRLAEDLRFQAANAADYHLTQLFNVDNDPNSRLSVLNVLETRFARILETYRTQVDSHFSFYRKVVLPTQLAKQFAVINKMMSKVFNSPWLQFARKVYNESERGRSENDRYASLLSLYSANETGQLQSILFKRDYFEFSNLLDILEIEQLAFAPLQIAKRFEMRKPRFDQAGFLRNKLVNEVVNSAILAQDADRTQTSSQRFSVKLPTASNLAATVSANKRPTLTAEMLHSLDVKQHFRLVQLALLVFDLLLFATRLFFTFNLAKALWAGLQVAHLADADAAESKSRKIDLLAYLKNRPLQCLKYAQMADSRRSTSDSCASSLSAVCEVFSNVWFTHVSVKRAIVIGICLIVACAFETVTSVEARRYDASGPINHAFASNARKQLDNLYDALESVLIRREKNSARRKVERMKQFTNQFNYNQWQVMSDHQLVGCALAQPNRTFIDADCLRTVSSKQQLLSTDYLDGCTLVTNRPGKVNFTDSLLYGRSATTDRQAAHDSLKQIARSLLFILIMGIGISELFCNYFSQLFLELAILRMQADGTLRLIECSSYPPQNGVSRNNYNATSPKAVTSNSNSLQHFDASMPHNVNWTAKRNMVGKNVESRL